MGRVYERRREMRGSKGIILLEVIVVTTLMSVVILGIWGSFHKIYGRYIANYKEGAQIEEITTVLEFIQKEVEDAEGVRIETEKLKNIMDSQQDIVDEPIKCIVFIPNKQEEKENLTQLSVILKGDRYEIIYQQGTVSETITQITVSKERDSTLVAITCGIQNKEEELISESILLSLAHKQ